MIVEVPQNVEALVVQHLRARGYAAQTELPDTPEGAEHSVAPGTVRVTRTGGDLGEDSYGTQDSAQIVVEVWGTSSWEAWNTAIRVWAEMRAVEHAQGFDGSMTYEVDPDVPRTVDDDMSPDMHHYQFLMTVLVPTTDIEIGEPDGG